MKRPIERLTDKELEELRRRHVLALANVEAELTRRRVKRDCSRIIRKSASPAIAGTSV